MHSCPECYQACYCSGDIEDHDTGNEYLDLCRCKHEGMGINDEGDWEYDIDFDELPGED